MEEFQYRENLKQRTKQFALRVIKLYQSLPKTIESQVIGRQILDSSSSVAANYRAACRARSNAEFYSKICIVVEETDETMFWLEMLLEAGIVDKDLLQNLYQENEEILKIMVVARKNSQKKKIDEKEQKKKAKELMRK